MKRILKLGILLFYVSVLSDVLGQSGEYAVKKSIDYYRNNNFQEHNLIKIDSNSFACFINYGFLNSDEKDTIRFYKINSDSIYFGKQIRAFPSVGVGTNIIFNPKNKQYTLTCLTTESISSESLASNLSLRLGVLVFDSLGNILWRKKYEFSNGEPISLNYLYSDGSYIYCLLGVRNNVQQDAVLLKLDYSGNVIFRKIYGGAEDEYPSRLTKVNSNKFVIVQYSESGNSGNKVSLQKGIWFVEIDSLGNKTGEFVEDSLYGKVSIINDIVESKDGGWVFSASSNITTENFIIKVDSVYKIKYVKPMGISNIITFEKSSNGDIFFDNKRFIDDGKWVSLKKIDSSGYIVWEQPFYNFSLDSTQGSSIYGLHFYENKFLILSSVKFNPNNEINLSWFYPPRSRLKGSVFPDFNSNCTYDKSSEYNIPKLIVRNKAESTYAITNDSNYTIHIFEKDTAVLEVVNLDGSLYTSCGKNSITLNMSSNNDTTGIDFPIRSNKSGHCINITSFSSGLLRPGRWGDYQLNFQNNAFDTAYNAYIEIELDMSTIDSIVSPYAFSQIGNILKFNLGHIKPFGYGAISYSIKLKTSVIIGSSQCHRAKVFPHCSLYPSNGYDGSDIKASVKCLGNNTIELELENAGGQNQTQRGKLAIYQDESLLKQDSFKMDKGTSSKFQYQLDDNKVFTAEVYSANSHPVTPILIRHQDLCANKRPIISNNPVVNFYRHDEAKEYEESCRIVQGSYDPNVKSVQPSGFLSEHYTANGTELKYRIDFQNTGTDTAFRVVLIDTLSPLLNIATFMPGVSSHPYSIEFGGRAVKFIFDPIALVDSFKNEPLSHGFVHFKIKPIAGIKPKTKIENKADIYFDYNAPIRTNTVFNTIFDTIQIYVPKGGSSIAENDKTSVIVFPNPTTDKFFIQMSEPLKDLSIEIYDVQGRMIKAASSPNNQTVEVSAQGMTKGIYHIRCMSGEKLIVVKKVMVE